MDTKGIMNIGTVFMLGFATIVALTLSGTIATNTDRATANTSVSTFSVTDEQVNYTGLNDTAIALGQAGSNRMISGTPIVENTTGYVFTGSNYSIATGSMSITVNGSAQMFQAPYNSSYICNVTYNYTSWTPPLFEDYPEATTLTQLYPLLYVAVPAAAIASLLA